MSGDGPVLTGTEQATTEEKNASRGIALDPKEMGKVINRLKRAQGQLAGVSLA